MTISYPRVYEYGQLTKGLWGLVSALMIAGGAAAAGLIWLSDLDIWWNGTITAVGAGLAVFGVICLISTLRGRLVLHEDGIKYTGVFATRTVARADVVTTAEWGRVFGVYSVVLVLRSRRRVAICDFGRMDDALEAWLVSLPNLEHDRRVAEHERLRAAVSGNLALGQTPEERYETYERDRRRVWWAEWPVWAVSLVCIVYPLPYGLNGYILIAIPLPVMAAVLVSRGRWSLLDDERSGRVSLAGLYVVPILCLTLLAFLPLNQVDWIMPLTVMAAGGLGLTGLVAVIERRVTWPNGIWVFVMCSLYVGSAAIGLNKRLDEAPPRIERTEVAGKRTAGDTNPDYYLKLKPSRSFGAWEERVSKTLYESVRPGDHLCIEIHPGRFGWEYYYVEACENAATQAGAR